VGAVYLSRDPRDIAVSYAEHRGTSIDSVIAFMADERAELSGAPDRFHDQWPQLLGSWSSHVKSWLDQREVPVQVTRFEDLLRQPAKLLENIAAFLGIAATALEIERAVAATHFEVLRDQEGAAGFVERGLHAKSRFFREGKAEGWRRHLTSAQARQIEEDQSHAMVQLGYL
jgi:aryl sulfotransferase